MSDPPPSERAIIPRNDASGLIEKRLDDDLERLSVELERAQNEVAIVRDRVAKTRYTSHLVGDSPETGIFALADMGRDWLALQVATMNYQDTFIRYTKELDRRAQERSENEVRSMTRAAQVSAEAAKTSARATVASVVVAVVALVVALLSHH